MCATILVTTAHPDAEIDVTAGSGREAVLHRNQVTGNQREQIARLRMRIGPDHAVAAIADVLDHTGIPVRQHHRHARLVGGDRGGEACHHIRPIGEICDATETFSLALGEVAAVRCVEPRQLRVVLRRDTRFDLQRRGVRHVGDQQLAVPQHVPIRTEFRAIQHDPDQRHSLAIQRQRRGAVSRGWIAPQRHARANLRRGLVEVERKIDGIDQERRRPIIGQARFMRRGLRRYGIGVERHIVIPQAAPRSLRLRRRRASAGASGRPVPF